MNNHPHSGEGSSECGHRDTCLRTTRGAQEKCRLVGPISDCESGLLGVRHKKYPCCTQASLGSCCNLSLKSPLYGFKARLRISVQAERGNFLLLNSSFSAYFRLFLPSVSSQHDPGLSFSITLEMLRTRKGIFIFILEKY